MVRLVLPTLVLLVACAAPDAGPSPRATVDAMLALAEAGDWAAYVDDYYGEQEKFSGPADRDALVARFRDGWGERVLEALRGLEGIEPVIEGERAVFRRDGAEVFVLYRDADGRWGFHL